MSLCLLYQNFNILYIFLHFTRQCSYIVEMWWHKDNDFIANSLLNPKMKEFLKSANIWRSYLRKTSSVFFDSQCTSRHAYLQTYLEIYQTLSPVMCVHVIKDYFCSFVDQVISNQLRNSYCRRLSNFFSSLTSFSTSFYGPYVA